MKEWTKDAQINTDRNLRLQYLAGLSLNYYIEKQLLEGILEHYTSSRATSSGFGREDSRSCKQVLESNGRHEGAGRPSGDGGAASAARSGPKGRQRVARGEGPWASVE